MAMSSDLRLLSFMWAVLVDVSAVMMTLPRNFTIVRVDPTYPFKPLSWYLSYTVHGVTGYGVLKALQDTSTKASGLLTSGPDCASCTWEWTTVERTQE